MTAKKSTCFNDLPAELRNRIYDLSGCLSILQQAPCFTYLQSTRFSQYHYRVECGATLVPFQLHGCSLTYRPLQPALTKVCKKVRKETLPMFYGALNLYFAAFPTQKHKQQVYDWLTNIGSENVALIRRLVVELPALGDMRHLDVTFVRIALELNKRGMKREAIVFQHPQTKSLFAIDWSRESEVICRIDIADHNESWAKQQIDTEGRLSP